MVRPFSATGHQSTPSTIWLTAANESMKNKSVICISSFVWNQYEYSTWKSLLVAGCVVVRCCCYCWQSQFVKNRPRPRPHSRPQQMLVKAFHSHFVSLHFPLSLRSPNKETLWNSGGNPSMFSFQLKNRFPSAPATGRMIYVNTNMRVCMI